MAEPLVTINTTRYSEFFRRVLQQYANDSTVIIDGRQYQSPTFPGLVQDWCTNAKIKRTQDFRLISDGKELFGFHDGPSDIWAAASEIAFLQQLVDEKIIHVRT